MRKPPKGPFMVNKCQYRYYWRSWSSEVPLHTSFMRSIVVARCRIASQCIVRTRCQRVWTRTFSVSTPTSENTSRRPCRLSRGDCHRTINITMTTMSASCRLAAAAALASARVLICSSTETTCRHSRKHFNGFVIFVL